MLQSRLENATGDHLLVLLARLKKDRDNDDKEHFKRVLVYIKDYCEDMAAFAKKDLQDIKDLEREKIFLTK